MQENERFNPYLCKKIPDFLWRINPLAERLRPKTLDDYIGQQHLVGKGKVLRKMIESGVVSSFILWGPPGVGKTTLAMIVAEQLKRPFYVLSAVSSGVKDVREVIQKAESQRFFNTPNPILFIDEITGFPRHSKILYWPQSKREPLP